MGVERRSNPQSNRSLIVVVTAASELAEVSACNGLLDVLSSSGGVMLSVTSLVATESSRCRSQEAHSRQRQVWLNVWVCR